MRLSFVQPHMSIQTDVTVDDVADFIVLSGPNGSGKSQLLEAIERGSITVDGLPPSPTHVVRRFVANQLVAPADGAQTLGAYRDNWVALETQVQSLRTQVETENPALRLDADSLEAAIGGRLVEQRQLTAAALKRLTAGAGKKLVDFVTADFRRNAPLLTGVRDPFQLSITELFLSYHNRLIRNHFQQWLKTEGKADGEPLTDDEFERRFGVPPWETLDETLRLIGLEYEFIRPEGPEENHQYEVKLRHLSTGAEVPTGTLSSGEKTLVAIAMTLYTGARMGETIELPKVLLLDEADASLHPSMVKSLLQVVREIFVGTYGVKVVMTTHSPTTVALAPEEALYIMRRGPDPRLRKASGRDEALSTLTVGISTLSVRVENRRTVFVESEHDEQCYQELARVMRADLSTEVSLEFVASGRGGQGNADAVRYLVKNLRERGNTSVRGLVDRDARQGSADGIVFDPDRYSIENLVLDPLILGAFLLREEIVTGDQIGLAAGIRHFELTGPEHGQHIIDAVASSIRADGDDDDRVKVQYVGGFELEVPRFWLDTRGHDLEARICEGFQPLKGFRHGLDSAVVSRGFGDLPEFVPTSIKTTFEKLLADAS